MRYSSAVVLSTITVGQAVAANVHNRHASFHARREAAKRGENDVNWSAVAYDLKDVKWDQVNWSSVFASSTAQPTPTPQEKKPVATPTPTPESKKETPASPTSKPAEASKPSETPSKPSSTGDKIDDIVGDVMDGVAAIASEFKFQVGKNSKSSGGQNIWIGKDGAYGMDVTNTGSDDAVWYCWTDPVAGAHAGPFLEKTTPDISVSVKPGKTVYLSFPQAVPAACSPLKASLPNPYGMVSNTWAEVNFNLGTVGTFDVSRNPNMQGSVISMKGKVCTSDVKNCIFQCKDSSLKSCTTGYELFNCGAHNGGQGGIDPKYGEVGGGCKMADQPERLTVTFT